MITRPTVLVLGAGASAPYGLPTGSGLAFGAYRDIKASGSPLNQQLRELDFATESAQKHMKDFEESDSISLDEFANTRPDLSEFIKAVIVCHLSRLEAPDNLFPDFKAATDNRPQWREIDWCRYLFRAMKTRRAEDFAKNKLRIITFNFDRSFEHRLGLMVRVAYQLTDKQAASVCSEFPIVHVHGSLGRHPWWPNWSASLVTRSYSPDTTIDERRALIKEINIVQDEVPQSVEDEAREHLQWAEHVWFLGFGYHPLNLKRLRLNEPLQGVALRGTALNLTAAELLPIRRFCGTNNIQLENEMDCLAFLRNEAVVLNAEFSV
jgi:hypothetical protein